jgi:hypothetical protein
VEGRLEFLGNASRCSEGRSFEEMGNMSTLTVAKADVWWYLTALSNCGGSLLETLPVKWIETCTCPIAYTFILAFWKLKPPLTKERQK